MEFNFKIILLSALVPLFMGFIWYNSKVFGNAWMKSCGFDPDKMTPPNPLIFLWCYLLSVLIGVVLAPIVIHQFGFFSTIINETGLQDPNSEIGQYAADFFTRFGTNFRTFKHGAFHGVLYGLLFVGPIVGTIALFEKKSFKYVAIHTGYWVLCLALMGGIICQFN